MEQGIAVKEMTVKELIALINDMEEEFIIRVEIGEEANNDAEE